MSMRSVCIALAIASALLATFRVPATATSSDGAIVFQNHGDVWLADSDGTNQRFLAGQPRYADQGISWSPDGKHVVYSGLGNGGQAIWMVNADGTDAHVIIDTPHYDLDPAISPDGGWVAFESEGGAGYRPDPEIWLARADGSDLTQLTKDGEYISEIGPAWSPNGKWLAFGKAGCSPTGSVCFHEIDRLPIAHPKRVRVLAELSPAGGPDWSPDGSRLVFAAYRPYPYAHIFTVNIDGSHLDRLTSGSIFDGSPTWSADGESILFGRFDRVARTSAILRIQADGMHKTVLITGGFSDFVASPDQRPCRFKNGASGSQGRCNIR